ncbi:hypothetical protein HSX11_12180 [Oxalobacteraceae bacterium]|nr:hypothetical protein [Oxalobacteraceae bacterium]
MPLALALACAPAAAQARDGDSDWLSYRDAYRQMIWFEKYGKPKQFLQNHYRIRLRDRSASTEGLRLTLSSKAGQQHLALDALGRAVFPFSKAAFDDNAELTVNRKAGQYSAGSWVSIVSRQDGVYDSADLRSACDQLLAFLRYSNAGDTGGKRCTGVQFAYARSDTDAGASFRKGDQAPQPLGFKEGPVFIGDEGASFRLYAFRFALWPDPGQVITRSIPLAIAALIE